ncbi:MAG: stage 0 sporulation family protein [Clostridium sp.]|nr:stage 0 sporulation family protein [Clostridium sp.]
MVKVVGVRFKKAGRIYYFDPGILNINLHENVIVETARGVEYGGVIIPNTEVSEDEIVSPLRRVIRVATKADMVQHEENIQKGKEAFGICLKKIRDHGLEMKLIDVEYTFDNNKVLFYFTADGRVDFRELVKDLASVFRTRIELRQIGVRDEAKMMGGLGICGRILCCKSFLGEFQPVSIKMAKEQGLSLNPSKISGACGRLMCCLKYEQEAYEEITARVPNERAIVETPDGQGVVMGVNLLKELLRVKLDKDNDADLRIYHSSEVKVIRDERREEAGGETELAELKELED